MLPKGDEPLMQTNSFAAFEESPFDAKNRRPTLSFIVVFRCAIPLLSMHPALRLGLSLGVLLLGVMSCQRSASPPPPTLRLIPFREDGQLAFIRDRDTLVTIAIEIAETDSARQRGLMERTHLPERSGMLFIFEREEMQSFWMANTPLSLDIIFVNGDSQIVSIAKYTRPYSTEPIPSRYPARFVVELPAGFTDSHGILEGDRIRWRRHPQALAAKR